MCYPPLRWLQINLVRMARLLIKRLGYSSASLLLLIAFSWGAGLTSSVKAQTITHKLSALSALRYSETTKVGEIQLSVAKPTLPADGQSASYVTVSLLGKTGKPFKEDAWIILELNAGRLLLSDALTDEAGPGGLSSSSSQGLRLHVKQGNATFKIIAPSVPQPGLIRATAGLAYAEKKLDFIHEARDWLVVGLLEGAIALRRVKNESPITSLRTNDGFDNELRAFERSLQEGKTAAAARLAFFVKGTISGQTLLTASFDSDKPVRERIYRDIKADQIYPVFGDASLINAEARTTQRLFVRVENGKNYALYGDFDTQETLATLDGKTPLSRITGASDLGSYRRQLNGVKAQFENEDASVSVFAAQDTLRQLTEEFNGNSGSFYSTSRKNVVADSETVDVIVRDRNNPGLVLSSQRMQRAVDYTFEPFNGRMFFKYAVQSTDSAGNPKIIRISYEVDQGGKNFLVAGVQGQVKLGAVTLGASSMVDKNPVLITQANERHLEALTSVQASVNISDSAKLQAEVAQTKNQTLNASQTGRAAKLALEFGATDGKNTVDSSNNVKGEIYVSSADKTFFNPSASVNLGRSEAGAQITASPSDDVKLKAQLIANKDAIALSTRQGAFVGAEYQIDETFSLAAGLRKSQDNGAGLYSPVQTPNPSLFGAGGLFNDASTLTPLQTPQTSTALGAPLDATTLQLGISKKLAADLRLSIEGESSVSGDAARRLATKLEWQTSELTAVSARYETQTGLGGYYDRASSNNQFVLGVNSRSLDPISKQGELFSEYRLRDAIGGRESQIASGLRNTFDVSLGLKAVIGIERIQVLNGASAPSWVLAGGLDYTADATLKAAARIELRQVGASAVMASNVGVLSTLSVAKKMDADWTLLSKNYFALTNSSAFSGSQSQDRFQIGVAYRPVDVARFDMLGKFEYRSEKNGEASLAESRRVYIASLNGNWQPTSRLWLSGRYASKFVRENNGLAPMSYRANLLNARVSYDVTNRWDVGVLGSVLKDYQARQFAYGLDAGYLVAKNLWFSLGYNFSGFVDKDLTGEEYTARGSYLRLKYKFDELSLGFSNAPNE